MASLAHLSNPVDQAPAVLRNASRFSHSTAHSSVSYDVQINQQTTLSRMYRFNEPGTYIEYPETGEKPVGYLFRMDPDDWGLPTHNFAYSLGSPGGYSEEGKHRNAIHISVLRNSMTQEQVSCSETHYTCHGVKVCPHGDMDKFSAPHTVATQENVASRLANDRDSRLMYASPSADIFAKTQAFITALRRGGCHAELQEHTPRLPSEVEIQQQNMAFQRGYHDKVERCKGRAIFQFDNAGKPFISCQHYDPDMSRDHLVQYLDDSYDLDYLEAVLEEDTDGIGRIGRGAEALGYGPRVDCTTITNASSQRAFCPFDHRTSDGFLEQATMVRMECGVKVGIFQPLEAHRRACPYVLVTVKGVHEHPIPLPLRTPPAAKAIVLDLIDKIGTELADLTTRRFLRHPAVRAYLQETFPGEVAPNFSQIHVSLANRAHLSSYIDKASKKKFPFGTGWEGVKHLKEIQDRAGNPKAIYVRPIIDISAAGVVHDIQDKETTAASGQDLRIIVCMTRKQSHRLLKAQYLQGDVAFKHVIGFKEFELASLNRDANTSLVFCRVFITRETAFSHCLVFDAIHEIMISMTVSFSLQLINMVAKPKREIAPHMNNIGLGLHLQKLAQMMSHQMDLHEPHRRVASLSPYKHLHRIFCLCVIHILHYIRECKGVTESVRQSMRSPCALNIQIGKAPYRLSRLKATNWVKNKVHSHFTFEGMCWEKSWIPLAVWRAGDSISNLIESVHSDVNQEGKGCSLLGAIEKGHHFDSMKMSTLEALETSGFRPSYNAGHRSENEILGLKRRFNFHHDTLVSQDKALENHRTKLQTALDRVSKAQQAVEAAQRALDVSNATVFQHGLEFLQTQQRAHARTTAEYQELLDAGKELAKGTGHENTNI
ncbi:hypothetical protein C8J56DRAFT_1058074 [Mycena floridula]|nr:hypothetical protein C8J56DRAFT_1058074 [Mycena floridula]